MNENNEAAQNINAILQANITIHGVNVSELLASQRGRIVALNNTIDTLRAELKRARADVDVLLAANRKAVVAEAEGAQDTDSGFNVSVKVTGNRPIPLEMQAMLADFEEMLRSLGDVSHG